GQSVAVDHPQEVGILDMRGSLGGANYWVGLHELVDKILERLGKEALWTKHTCDLCCQQINYEGDVVDVRCAVADGLTAVRFRKCSVYNCTQDIRGLGSLDRYCAFHAPLREHRCAITTPECPNDREDGRLT
ncbi:unnamed protein product, partial [Ectocarpus fasciculatus]